MKNYYLDRAEENEIVTGYYIWGDGEPQLNWSSYIGKLVERSEISINGQTEPCYMFQFADGLCANCVLEKDFHRARPATRKEINAAIEREKKLHGVNLNFL